MLVWSLDREPEICFLSSDDVLWGNLQGDKASFGVNWCVTVLEEVEVNSCNQFQHSRNQEIAVKMAFSEEGSSLILLLIKDGSRS